MTESFLEALDRRVLVCDGAMGTMLYARGVFLNRCFDELNLTHPDVVAEVHQEYVRAGADVIETNTFGANRYKLGTFGLDEQVRQINVDGARIARRAARDVAWVAGSIGPLGVRIEPWGKTSIEEAEAAFEEQAAALEEGGADLFLLETFRDLAELRAAIRAVRRVSQKPIVAQMTTEDDGNSLDGTPPETFGPALEQAGANVIGVNCSVGPAAMLETLERVATVTNAPLSAQPNAGRPRDVDGRNLYLCSPEYMATYAKRFITTGARLVGGCCGTTPDHIRQIKSAVRALSPAAHRVVAAPTVVPAVSAPVPVARQDKSNLARALASGQFVIVAEVAPPRGSDVAAVVARAQHLRDLGVIAVNVPDYAKSGARVSALALSVLLEQTGHVETMLHYACRDRLLATMQADLLGAHAMGLRNILLVTGEPARVAGYSDATSVFDVDAIGLTNMVARLNHGLDTGGQAIGPPTAFHVGVAVNPFAADLEAEWRRLDYKVEAGAEFLVTPPIFDIEAFDRSLDRLRSAKLPIIAGVVALDSLRQAEFLASEVAGVRMPDAVLARLRDAADARAEGLAITVELLRALKTRVQGVQISPLHGSPDIVELAIRQVQKPSVAR